MSRHQGDLTLCLKQPGTQVGQVCDKCDGRCPLCDSFVKPTAIVKVCDECGFGQGQTKCIICGNNSASHPAYYCWECVMLDKNRDGCPNITNLGSNKLDKYYEKQLTN